MKRFVRVLRATSMILLGGFSWLGACSASSKAGVTVAVETEAPRLPSSDTGVLTFPTAGGGRVTLTRGYLTTGSVEIFACHASVRWLDWSRMAVARAHVTGSPTLLGVPSVESLLGDGARTKVGELHPPAGSYCRVKQTILAADPDAPGSPADGSMLGRSMLLEGTHVTADGTPRAFVLSSTASFDVETTIDALPLSLESRRTATIVLAMANEAWFDGVDLDGDPVDAAARVLENLRASLGARIE